MGEAGSDRKDTQQRRGLIGQTLGGCRVDEKLGQGGMGAVFKGQHLNLDKPVAIKVLPPSFARADRANIDRFIREARSAAKVQHTNIISVLNVGHEKGLYYIIMEYVEGEDLADRLDVAGYLPVDEAVEITCQIADALEAARKVNIIHRDVKPENILIDSEGNAKLADLGLAKDVEEDHDTTQAGTSMGTPHYVAPEQGRDATQADHRSDIYSLGCTLYKLLTGNPPYEGKSSYEIVHQHVHAPIPDPRAANKAIPKAVADVLMRMMAKRPEERYQTADEVAQDLRKIQAGEPVVKKPVLRPRALAPAGLPHERRKGTRRKTSRQTRSMRPSKREKKNMLPLYIGGSVAAALVLFLLVHGLSGSTPPERAPRPTRVTPVRIQPAPAPQPNPAALQPSPPAPHIPRPAHVPADATAFQGHWYKFFPAKLTWHAAKRACEQRQGYLACVESAAENRFLADLANGAQSWLGATDEHQEGQWRWVNGQALNYKAWARGQPNNIYKQQHYMVTNYKTKGEWDDNSRTAARPFLCEWEPAGARPTAADTHVPTTPAALHAALKAANPHYRSDAKIQMQGGRIYHVDLGRKPVTDLAPLRGVPLAWLSLAFTPATDLRPLAGMPLKELHLSDTRVRDLTPLQGLPIERLYLWKCTEVQDISALRGMPLERLEISFSKVSDLSPLRGMKLNNFHMDASRVMDLAPLSGMPMQVLNIADTHVTDLTPLTGMPLQQFIFTPRNITQGIPVVRGMTTMQKIGPNWKQALPPKQFWARYDQGAYGQPAAAATPQAWKTIFNGRDLSGWRRAGKGYVEDGALVSESDADLFFPAQWSNFEVECEIMSEGKGTHGIGLLLGHSAMGRGSSNRVGLLFHGDGDLHVRVNGKRIWRSGSRKFPLASWLRLRLVLTQDTLTVYKNDKPAGTINVANAPTVKGGLYFYAAGPHKARLRNIRVRERTDAHSGSSRDVF